jgi:heme/copper-type cytochrome/quinol oxidase subunit 4
MKIIDYIMTIVFSAFVVAAAVSIRSHGALTVGVAPLLIPIILRLIMVMRMRECEKKRKFIRRLDYLTITVWIFLYIMIIIFGNVPDNSRIGWPD